MSDAVKINYTSEGWEPNFWYVTPLHGEVFEKEFIPTEWTIQMLDPEGKEGDMKLVEGGFSYFHAQSICNEHNEIIWNINRDFDPELRGVDFKNGGKYVEVCI